MSDITPEDVELVKAFTAGFFNASLVKNININNINDDLLILIAEILHTTHSCTDSITLLPQPSDLIPGSRVGQKVLKYLRSVGARSFDRNKISFLCRAKAQQNFSREYQRRLQGY